MNQEEREKRFDEIIDGIDKTDSEQVNGWWETSTGAKFGAEKKEEIKAFIQSEIDLALANRNKELVEKIEVWLPCEQGEGTAIKNDGSQMKLIAIIVGSKIIHLEKDAYIEMTKLSKEEADNYQPNNQRQ